jgi:anthraniloyl-CoA monooxygenase
MKILCVGGGPAGLYFALLMKLDDPTHDIIVVERNQPYDTFGWGVVFSDATLDNLRLADPVSAAAISDEFSRWDDLEIHFKDRVIRSGGHGFIGIGRKKLLNILQARCEAVGVTLVFATSVDDEVALARRHGADLVIASDGVNSAVRGRHLEAFRPDIDLRQCRFVWLGTRRVFDAFNFIFVSTEHGWFQAHAYRFENGLSTFIVETTETTWKAARIDRLSQEEGIAYCERLFARWLDGHALICNAAHQRGAAIWIRFPRVICGQWVHWEGDLPVVLMGDAAHTAHFSIGSGTKLALEDAIELTRSLKAAGGDLRSGLERYQAVRSVEVLKIQSAARNSTDWFENVSSYAAFEPEQFAYSLLTRSQRISHENLRLRDKHWLQNYERWIAARAGAPACAGSRPVLPMLTPYTVRGLTLTNRIVVSPMLLYSCNDGVPGPLHQVHLGSRALGGAGLVLVEMTAVAADARVTRGCPGLWNDQQAHAFGGIVRFVHEHTSAAIGIQLGHAGRRGSTQRGWANPGHPLYADNWPLVSASAVAFLPGVSQVPRAMTRTDMDEVRDAFVAAVRRAAMAGFDWLELQAGHGFLLSTFISPLTNLRRDAYGGSLENRLRFPLEVFAAMRAEWPAEKPMSVRISATDWAAGGTTSSEAVLIGRLFHAAGADIIDCSGGEVIPDQKPVYGRMYQTPLADRIRNEGGVPTIAVGAISEGDQINGIIASGRADLCAVGRPYLADASWALREAARLGYREIDWPAPYRWGKSQLERSFRPSDAAVDRLVRNGEET